MSKVKLRLYQIAGELENPLIMKYGRGYLEYQATSREIFTIAERLGLKTVDALKDVKVFQINKKDIGTPCRVIDIKTRQYIR